MINGLAGSSQDWDPRFLAGLAEHSRLVLADNRGIGASPDSGGPFTITDLAGDYARLITSELGGEPASVLGWSMGGFIAQALALEHPELVAKLVLLATDLGGPEAELGDPAVLEQLVDLSPPPEAQARQLLSLLFDDATGAALYPEVGQLVAAARAELDQDVLNRQREALEAWHRDGVVRRLGQLSLPVLVAAGTADRVLPPTNSLILAQAIADAWLLRFPGAGHAFMAQYPGPLSTVINQFLAL